ncbi:hypothetical protein [Marinagarivorans cellulosilyticus]|uniref:hypothetical protein n=1 Tax=Marinagarivorans cellulosilyticus TaxID=2721545 RepID=UPI001F38AB1F|nr:hypothetical protein [Marinagarivorans cellulosilyticus]
MKLKRLLNSRLLKLAAVAGVLVSLSGCEPQVYGSVGMSTSSFGSYNSRYGSSPRMSGSISVGGRIF